MRSFEAFTHKEANFRLSSSNNEAMKREIIQQRAVLDEYIRVHPEFAASLVPVDVADSAPEIVQRMHKASLAANVGPMAAVAGTFSQLAVEAVSECSREAIAENGGDIFLSCIEDIHIGLWAGESSLSGEFALRIAAQHAPLSICSSSSTMGHSLSLGCCNLGTVLSRDASIADACATLLCNLIREPDDLSSALEYIASIDGVLGALAVKDEQLGLVGEIPELVKCGDLQLSDKITRAEGILL